MMKFLGNCIGVRLEERSDNDQHVMVVLMVEDDTNWFDKLSVSSFWLDEMISVLTDAKASMERSCKKVKWGYEFVS